MNVQNLKAPLPVPKLNEAQRVRKERQLLEELVDLGNKFRNTPIVDDDFCAQRDAFDLKLMQASEHLKEYAALQVCTSSMIYDGCMGEQRTIVTYVQEKR